MLQIFIEKEGREQLCDCVTMEIPGGENSFGRKRSLWNSVSKVNLLFHWTTLLSQLLSKLPNQLRERRGVVVQDTNLRGYLDLSLLSESMEGKLVGARSPNVWEIKNRCSHSTLLGSSVFLYFDQFQTITANICFFQMPSLYLNLPGASLMP